MRPLAEQTILVTGATDGLGRALAADLAAAGADVLVHGRDEGRGRDTLAEIRERAPGARVRFLRADLASLAEVRDLAAQVERESGRLDVLVNNAGIGAGLPEGRERSTSADGYELRFAVNYLAGFLLTVELLPLLRASAPARIVNVASIGQSPVDFDDIMLEKDYDGWRAYRQSKLAQIMSGFELAAQVPADQVTVNSLHPATFMPTKMVLQEMGHHVDSLEDGVAATYRLVCDPALATVTGRFFDRTEEATANAQAYDPPARAELWRRSLALAILRRWCKREPKRSTSGVSAMRWRPSPRRRRSSRATRACASAPGWRRSCSDAMPTLRNCSRRRSRSIRDIEPRRSGWENCTIAPAG